MLFIHTVGTIKNWFDENVIPLVDWPPYSPDLNPTENNWVKLNGRIYMHHSDLASFDGTKEELKEQFHKMVEAPWERLGYDYFNPLIRSM